MSQPDVHMTPISPTPKLARPVTRVLFDLTERKDRNVRRKIIGVKRRSATVNVFTPSRKTPGPKQLEEHIAQSCRPFLDGCIATIKAEFQSLLAGHVDRCQQTSDDMKHRINDLRSLVEEQAEVVKSLQERNAVLRQELDATVGERRLTTQRLKELNGRIEALETERSTARSEPIITRSQSADAKALDRRMEALEKRLAEHAASGPREQAVHCRGMTENVDSVTARVATLEERFNDWERTRTAPADGARCTEATGGRHMGPKAAPPAKQDQQYREELHKEQQERPKQQQPKQQPRPNRAVADTTTSKAPKVTAITTRPHEVAASCRGFGKTAGAPAPRPPKALAESSSSTDGHIDRGALVIDGLPATWTQEEVIQKLQLRLQQLTNMKVAFLDCTVEAHPNVAARSSKRTTQRVRITTTPAAYYALYSLRKQLGLNAEEGADESFPAVRVSLALTALGESYKKGYQDVFRHLVDSKRAPSWRGTHLMALTEPDSGVWAKIDIRKMAAELRQAAK
ncbi:hypothetical protein VOLCADRAFT_93648 [Volvox carteri f. nagariensis]|uniref:Uncharacterized protein n=1 Tax=Volvox carteri f. nagariensis TaxID=3068 RepID=D8U2N5_VOLCA|nr:uncharacterized protein VOLCADRAFT_93648 [Volvox carteri f. nagariensis]EFJ45929.1 hypothetical protein VOLCADRAFT_93648 [Volvox carteri f. nagariensis]|eukprot:XP_002953007.1 hypothetical protein VOLCADRAFT_93648 [Volvox carteri f. nagariensis]